MTPKSILSAEVVQHFAKDNLFLAAIAFIHEMKRGPFHEHSPMLHDISAVPSWRKVNSGLMKLFFGEILNKFPVMQHFEFGSILSWDPY